MATLVHFRGERAHRLGHGHQIGRSRRKSDLHIDHPSVSSVHAIFTWSGARWELRDLSTNGTFIDGERVPPGEDVGLPPGCELTFGEASPWRLTDVRPPEPGARHAEGREVGADGMLFLPSADAPRAMVGLGSDGGWWLDAAAERRPVEDGEWVEVAGMRFQLELPIRDATAEVLRGPRMADLSLRFDVSLNEEAVSIAVDLPTGVEALDPRAHHYFLVTLARARLRDAEAGLPEAERGWVDGQALARDLLIDDNLLYTYVFRSRKTFAALGVDDASDIVERRPVGQLRIGVSRLEVTRGGSPASDA